MKDQAYRIQEYILKNLTAHSHDIVAVATHHFAVTRTTIHRHINQLIKLNQVIKSGTTKNIKYYLASSLDREFTYDISAKLSEYDVFDKNFNDVVEQFPQNIDDICHYAFTEIFNNAIDHSRGTKITASTSYVNEKIILKISDDGIGIFDNIFNYFNLDDIRESILQLNKGKMTTDPANHSGEGLFFTSKVFDKFEIFANNLYYLKDNIENDWGIETISTNKGSTVCMTISKNSKTDLVSIFEKFQEPDSLAFDRTEILVELSMFGDETLMSRSQAKRITLGLEKFNIVTLDFSGVRLIGQGFVDEIFRVYANAHPDVSFRYINANDDVTFMIKRGLATAS